MAVGNTTCFAWCVSFKNACNERWARFRNRFRRGFYARRNQSIDQSTILNETGTADMAISRVPYKANKVEPINMASMTTFTESAVLNSILSTDADKGFEELVEEYVSDAISRAADTLLSERKHQTFDNTRVVITADDNLSLTSSIISQMADNAVTESLTNIVLDGDTNQSAAKVTTPRCIKEFMDMFGVADGDTVEDELPPVSC